MKTEVRVIIGIFLVVIALAVTGYYVKNSHTNEKALYPFGESFDLFSFFKRQERPKYVIYGYLPYWSLDGIDNLQMDKLTHIAYFGAYINADGTFKEKIEDEDGYIILEPGYDKWKTDSRIDDLIKKAKKAGVRIAFTVIAHEDETTDKFLDCPECWPKLLESIITELDRKGITDVNLNFEYAEYTDSDKAQKFAQLTKYLNEELDNRYFDSYLVVSAFADSAVKERVSSDLGALGRNADAIFIMAYDFHRPQSDNAGPIAPIDKKDTNSDYDLKTMLHDYLSKIAPNKLILGVPYYGYNWVVESEERNAKRIEGTDEIGFSQSQSYVNILDTIDEVKPEIKWDDNAKEAYFTYKSPDTGALRQVFYETPEALKAKYELAKQSNLAGVGIWALGYDGDKPELWNLLHDEFVK